MVADLRPLCWCLQNAPKVIKQRTCLAQIRLVGSGAPGPKKTSFHLMCLIDSYFHQNLEMMHAHGSNRSI